MFGKNRRRENAEQSKQLYHYVRLVAPTDMSVIIEGESGTGKENVAQTIHQLSARSKNKFVAVDCGALSKELAASELFGHVKGAFTGAVQDKVGQFEEAHRGTLFWMSRNRIRVQKVVESDSGTGNSASR